MDKILGLAADVVKAVLPVAADMARQLLVTVAKLLKLLGRLCLSALKSKGTKRVLRKGRKALRITALVSGGIAVLSCAGLILGRRK